MHPVEIVRLQFKAAAGEAAGVELSMRMLADKVPELRAFVLSLNAFNNAGAIIERLLNAADSMPKRSA